MVEQQQGQSAQEVAQRAAQAAEQLAQAAAARTAQAQEAAARPVPTTGLEQLSYAQLRSQLAVLQEQRQTLAGRRDALANGYEGSSGANQAGMGARLQILDNNIIQYEAEIAAVGHAMAAKAPGRASVADGGTQFIQTGYSDDDMAGAVFGTFIATALLMAFFMKRYARRRWGGLPRAAEPASIQSNERLDRIEQAVDTIAVEIERVSENQRFMTRLMTETQLGASIAAVRSSTELAKSAGEGG